MIHLLREFKSALFFSRLFKSVNVSPEEKDNVTTSRGSFLVKKLWETERTKKGKLSNLSQNSKKRMLLLHLFDFQENRTQNLLFRKHTKRPFGTPCDNQMQTKQRYAVLSFLNLPTDENSSWRKTFSSRTVIAAWSF